jgi:hypothetical protein
MAVVAGAVSALVVGFIAGYLCGRKCHKDEDDNLPYPDTEYEYFEQRQNMNRYESPEETTKTTLYLVLYRFSGYKRNRSCFLKRR